MASTECESCGRWVPGSTFPTDADMAAALALLRRAEAERDALREQVARVRALADEWPRDPLRHPFDARSYKALRAALDQPEEQP